jgi:energy-coupling factor transporter ATP-binding protein EcfA2
VHPARPPSIRRSGSAAHPLAATMAPTTRRALLEGPALNPFPGPQPYRASDRALFHGREALASKLEASILASRCVTVHGPSGAGKSSLAQAAVLPAIIESHDARVVRVDGWPEDKDPLEWLALSMFTDLKLGDVPADLGAADAVLAAAKRAARASSRLMVVYLDQLEQLFYPGRSQEQTEPFFACLQDLAELPLRTVRVVLSLREDYLGRFRDRLRDRGRMLDNSFRVGPLTVAELTSAVCEAAESGEPPQTWSPDEMRPLLLQVRVPGQAADDNAEAQAAYAQIVCRALFLERTRGESLKQGNVAKAETILRGYLETTLADLGALREPAQRLLEDHLVTGDGSRTLRTEKELLRVVSDADLQEILWALESAAILHAEEHQGSRYFEIGHDWLARKVFEQRKAREAIEEQRRTDEAQRREQEQREAELGRRLAEARRERLRLLGLAAGALVFAAVTGVLFYVAQKEKERAVLAQKEAHEARIDAVRKRVEAADQRILAGHLTLSARGEQAIGMKLLGEVKFPAERKGWASYASDALDANALRATLRGHTAPLTAVELSPDGKRVLTASADGTARVWSADGTGPSTVIRGHRGPITAASISPDGQRVLTTSEDGTACVWNLAGDPAPVKIAAAPEGVGLLCGAFSPDGQSVALGGEDGILRIRPVNGTGDPIDRAGHTGPIRDLAFLPDGRFVGTGSDDGTARLWPVNAKDPPLKLGAHRRP